MTDAECAEILAEFRKLTLGPELSAAMDHAIGKLQAPRQRCDDCHELTGSVCICETCAGIRAESVAQALAA